MTHEPRSPAAPAARPSWSSSSTSGARRSRTRCSRDASSSEPEPRFPLDLVFCPACALVQITETVPPEQLFRDYVYFSSFSDTMLAHARELAGAPGRGRGSSAPAVLVVEIASNDGYLLQYYEQAGVPVLGIEPARNIAKVAERARASRRCASSSAATLAAQLRRRGPARRRHPRQQRARPRRRPERLRRRHPRRPASTSGVAVDRGAVRAAT